MSLRASQVKDVLHHIIKNNRYLESHGKKKNSILIESDAGIGKTSIVQQVAEESGLGFVKVNLSNIEQAGDLLGYPYVEMEYCGKNGEDGGWVSSRQLEHSGKDLCLTGRSRTSYSPPAWVPTDGKGIVLLLDDFTRAPTHIMQAVMEIIDKGEYLSWKLPEDCHVFLTSNPSDSGDYIVTSLDDAQATRFIKLIMKFDVNEWAAWAEKDGVDSRCINFLMLNPEMIKGKINARLATDYFASISSLEEFSSADTLNLINLLGEGSVGPEFSASFALFINNRLDKVPSPKEIYDAKDDDTAIAKLAAAVGKVDTQSYKQNIASVLSSRLINYADKIIEEKTFNKKTHVNRIINIIKSKVFSGDINYNLVKSLNMKKQFAPLIEDEAIRKIVTR